MRRMAVLEVNHFKRGSGIKMEVLLREINALTQEANPRQLPKLLELILHYAYQLKASDIHIEPHAAKARVRVRIDGILSTLINFDLGLLELLISRLKVLAELDVAERRLPQDGRFFVIITSFRLEYRLSICPLAQAEKAVIRLVNLNEKILTLRDLGLLVSQLQELESVLHKPHGLILVSGPTGSGKTLTQYAILNYLNAETRNLISIEDPVEVLLPGVNQIHVNNKTGLEFNKILRAILRQDPDVIMIGEIRDLETAEVAVKAAETGHLVLATLHANSAWDSLQRLEHIGVPAYALRACVRLLLAQRLIRCLCRSCQGKKESSCVECVQGYRGRTGIFELINLNQGESAAQGAALEPPKYVNLYEAGLTKVASGITKLEEVNRVV